MDFVPVAVLGWISVNMPWSDICGWKADDFLLLLDF